jgi:hypothetical protein
MQVNSIIDLIGQPVQQVPIIGFIGNLFLAAILSYILGDVFVRYGRTLSNRKMLAANFVLITVTTMFIITVVKSSLALSLGLVGALSIVRFRTAIKEPEELAYLFLAIAVGLGLGADQTVATLVAFVFVVTYLWLRSDYRKNDSQSHMYLTVTGRTDGNLSFDKVLSILKKHCASAYLNRHDESQGKFEGVFVVEFVDIDVLSSCRAELRQLDPSIAYTFIDSRT